MVDTGRLWAGAAAIDITPQESQFLYGYPHVRRFSTGVHDPLYSSALFLSDDFTSAVFITNDVIWISKQSVQRVRERISRSCDIPPGHILISATHTHSGPLTLDYLSNEADLTVPKTDPEYVRFLEDAIVTVATAGVRRAQLAEVGLIVADGGGIGTNRRHPLGPADREVPVLMVRSAADSRAIACMLVCSMHPTVLHEDSTLVSADFPGMARQYLQREILGTECPVLYHTGPSGNQSPRHVTRANTFDEAERLGFVLGSAVAAVLPKMEHWGSLRLKCSQAWVDLPRRSFPHPEDAEAARRDAAERLKRLRKAGAPRQEVRTAEVDLFGAEETLALARAAANHRVEAACECCLPAEIQAIRIGSWTFVGWQGEIFVEYALAVKARARDTFVISLANGELQGYIVTPEAAEQRAYEAGNALFHWSSGDVLVSRTLKMLTAME
jgi:hypothetical protein